MPDPEIHYVIEIQTHKGDWELVTDLSDLASDPRSTEGDAIAALVQERESFPQDSFRLVKIERTLIA